MAVMQNMEQTEKIKIKQLLYVRSDQIILSSENENLRTFKKKEPKWDCNTERILFSHFKLKT